MYGIKASGPRPGGLLLDVTGGVFFLGALGAYPTWDAH